MHQDTEVHQNTGLFQQCAFIKGRPEEIIIKKEI